MLKINKESQPKNDENINIQNRENLVNSENNSQEEKTLSLNSSVFEFKDINSEQKQDSSSEQDKQDQIIFENQKI